MKHFKDFMKDIETSGEEESTEEEVDTTDNEEVETKEDSQDDARIAFGKGADAFDHHQSMQKNPNKKAPVRKKPTLTIPKGHELKDKQDRDREAFYKK